MFQCIQDTLRVPGVSRRFRGVPEDFSGVPRVLSMFHGVSGAFQGFYRGYFIEFQWRFTDFQDDFRGFRGVVGMFQGVSEEFQKFSKRSWGALVVSRRSWSTPGEPRTFRFEKSCTGISRVFQWDAVGISVGCRSVTENFRRAHEHCKVFQLISGGSGITYVPGMFKGLRGLRGQEISVTFWRGWQLVSIGITGNSRWFQGHSMEFQGVPFKDDPEGFRGVLEITKEFQGVSRGFQSVSEKVQGDPQGFRSFHKVSGALRNILKLPEML